MEKTFKVVMLPTEKASGIQLADDSTLRFTNNNSWKSQHI